MALIDSRRQRIFTLCGLYVAQGVPWGFMMITLPAYLSSEFADQFGVKEIGRLKAMILVPWAFKLVWAPLMESFTFRSMGRRRVWIIGSELMMAVTLLGFIGLGDPAEKLQSILIMYFIHNCFASLQDVCTDALAVDVLPIEEYGQMNGLMWCSKLIGKGVGAGGLAYVLSWGGLRACAAVQIGLLLGIMLIPILILERPGEKRFPWSKGAAVGVGSDSARSLREVIEVAFRAFSMTTLLAYFVFALIKVIGVGVVEVVINNLCTQELDPVWNTQDFSRVAGLYTIPFVIVGTMLCGYIADRYGRRIVLCLGFGGYGLAAMIFAACPGLWDERWFTSTYIVAADALFAIGSVGFLSMAMRISWTASAATVFTTYMTLSNISHVIGSHYAGEIKDFLTSTFAQDPSPLVSYELTFWFAGIMTILPLALLVFVKPDEVDEARAAEEAERADDAELDA